MSRRSRNVGLCLQNLNLGPGAPRALEMLCYQQSLLAGTGFGQREVAGRLLDCLDDECICHGDCLFFK